MNVLLPSQTHGFDRYAGSLRRVVLSFLIMLVAVTSGAAETTATSEQAAIAEGSGFFDMRGGLGHEDDTIRVHYYKPRNFTPQSPVLIVVAGAGRNGDGYRDSWIGPANEHGILVLAPSFAEQDYDMGDYQFGGIIRNVELRNVQIDPGTQIYHLKDEDVSFRIEKDPRTLLFHDFDRLFEVAKQGTKSERTQYDIFGHSAGGQILHRFALFHPHSNAGRIVAANAGFYTLPTFDVSLPLGLGGTTLKKSDLDAAFATRLILLLGERDNEQETRGIHLRTPLADKQGIGRLARGKYFFDLAQKAAAQRSVAFNWKLQEVPGVGHDQKAMSAAAAHLLYP